MSASEQTLKLLTSIDATLKQMLALMQQRESAARAARPKPVASDRDLDGKYGDPKVSFNPRDWTGGSCKGLRMSECPADFLEMLASTLDYFADQAERKGEVTDKGKPVAEYKRQDAARARGWAKRIRDGKVTRPAAESQGEGWETDENGDFVDDFAPAGWGAER